MTNKPYLVRCDPIDGGCDNVYAGDLDNCPKCFASTVLVAIAEPINPLIYVYDIETYPTAFTMCVTHPASGFEWTFEISIRKNQYLLFNNFINLLGNQKAIMVGYNNLHFDYPVIHHVYNAGENINVRAIYHFALNIIKGQPQKMIYDNQRLVKQLDLFKINHFDNKAKRTSLKALEIFMRMKSIKDLPYKPGTVLNPEQIEHLITYNKHDVLATVYFYVRCLEMIRFRSELSAKYHMNFTNMSDSKIGSEIFCKNLNDVGIQTHYKDSFNKKQAMKTERSSIPLIDCIPDYIKFEMPEFQGILERFKDTTLHGDNVKALFSNFSCEHDGITYYFGAGGQHACRSGYFESNDLMVIVDQDVASMYPSIAIVNNYYPEHLGNAYSPIYKELVDERKRVGKKSIMGAGLKISANGTYGNSGNKYSPFYDLKYLLSTTLTGQLTLSMLVEQILKIPDCTILQTNTDGITYLIPRHYLAQVDKITKWWEGVTMLELENAYYSRMWLSDVNNYIAESMEL